MNALALGLLKGSRRLARLVGLSSRAGQPIPATDAPSLVFDARGQHASDLIRDALERTAPTMIARIGHTELKAMLRWKQQAARTLPANALRYICGRQGPFWWDEPLRWELLNSSGFFPCTEQAMAKFASRCLADLGDIDVLGSWLPGERSIEYAFPRARCVPLQDLEPFWHPAPWTTALEGKTVLVVHPFERSIRSQYARRAQLVADSRILPEFNLITLPAVQSLGGRHPEHATWFDALDAMCRQISALEFDIALIGAGAYGLPLAAYVKQLGRKAVHLGGASQLLFGIRGARWEKRPEYAALMNEHWVRPLPDETPEGHANVDQGLAYW